MIRQITITQGDSARLWDLTIEGPSSATARYVISTGPGQRALLSGPIDLEIESPAIELTSEQTSKLIPGRYFVGIAVESQATASRKEIQGTIFVKPSVAYGFSSTSPSGSIEDISVSVKGVKGVF